MGVAASPAMAMAPQRKPSLLLLFIVAMAMKPAFGSGHQKSYIIAVDPTRIPAGTHQSWYQSTLASLNPTSEIIHAYNHGFNGFAAQLTDTEAQSLRQTAGFMAMYEDKLLNLHTTRSPQFLGLNPAKGIWPESKYGSDSIIGVIDTGIWPESQSFRDEGMGEVPKKWKGKCEEGEKFSAKNCNKKLIGARVYYRGYERLMGGMNWTGEFKSARDSQGHGTHTASIAAGRRVLNASFFGLAAGVAQGMAPLARIAVYKVCWGECATSDVLAAVDQALGDGVDAISLSLGGSVSPYYDDLIAIVAFAAMKRGVFFSASAGNDGPSLLSVGNDAPWIATVGASTMDRSFPAVVSLGSGQIFPAASFFTGSWTNRQKFPLLDPSSSPIPDKSSRCLPGFLNPDLVRGKIVLCQMGSISDAEKSMAVHDAGGLGMILIMPAYLGDGILPANSYLIPAASVSNAAGIQIKKYINATANPKAGLQFLGTKLGVKPAPQVAAFSSRGPGPVSLDVLKPDLIAPGANILGAWSGSAPPSKLISDNRRTDYNILSGTSMSCPHISGIAALLKSAHPNWSPAAIKSALMTTADYTDQSGRIISDQSTGSSTLPFDFGSGHVNPQKALDPGLIYDLTERDYSDFLCSQNYTTRQARLVAQSTDVRCSKRRPRAQDFNYPSFSLVFYVTGSDQKLSMRFKRTVTNVGPANSTYSAMVVKSGGLQIRVRPKRLVFSATNERKRFVVQASLLRQNSSELALPRSTLSLTWSDGKHHVRTPITVLLVESFGP